MNDLISTYAYPASVTVVILALYSAGNLSLLNKKRRMLKRVKKREVFDPIQGDTPDEIDDNKIIIKNNINSISIDTDNEITIQLNTKFKRI